MVGAWVVNMEEVWGVTMEGALEVIMMMGSLVVSFEVLLYFRNHLEYKPWSLITEFADVAALFAV